MNERIKKLAEQAGFETDRGPLIGPGPYIKVGRLCVGVPLEKFAELIIRECCDVLQTETIRHDGYGYNQGFLHKKIKEHFGVE